MAAAACAQPLASAASDDAPAADDVQALRWLAAGHDRLAFLTTRPVECSRPIADPQLAAARDRGRAAFESPALLGGAAGRRGLSCSSCHINGRGNPDFFVEGLSNAPGTADVTSSILSKVTDDALFNPKPIPDITARDGTQIRDRTGADFHARLHGLIVDEFNGQEPPSAVFEDVRIYLDHLDFAVCSDPATRLPVSASADLASVATALGGARAAADFASREFWIRVARRRLERIDERFVGPALAGTRQRIETLSRRLGEAADTSREWTALQAEVKAKEALSLYNPIVLRAAFAAQRP